MDQVHPYPRTAAVSLARAERRARLRAGLKAVMSFGAMAGVGALLVSTSLPANAFQSPGEDAAVSASAAPTQTMVVQSAAAPSVNRDTFTVIKPAPKPEPKPAPAPVSKSPLAARSNAPALPEASATIGSYSNNASGSVQWPFPSSPITSGFGPRGGGFHYGVDFFPGEGTPIGAIADGVVTAVASNGGWGNYVTVAHTVNGQNVTSLYAHMKWGSVGVAAGQEVTVGTYLGAVGATGRAYGAHLHLETYVDGVPVDPFAWLKANAN